MFRDDVIDRIRAHELKAAGVLSLAVFGSVARGDDKGDSDVDVVVRLDQTIMAGGFTYFGRVEALRTRLGVIVGRPVDLLTEPIRKARLRRWVLEEAARAF